ncbi:K(+)-transporting ATPase subunit C [Calothrix sp. NIES-3974]|uniref:K(+)-transporting ATPase subunit C n=1 Tax=Calothrix sp. NIES-3974 TaxID=2005462 RepID=UPI000B602E55|nr:K(+)-transporting ATPase subunit C [Calothrix sp. NIES-3974]BAZ05157.1 potassium-transporting P-type ATPase C chain [Calothrix sp. NIES-3974]
MRELIIAIRNFFVLWVLTALIYPFLMIFISQTAFPFQANGSLIINSQQQVIGSTLIGQNFSREGYFWSRPSTINYSEGEDYAPTGVSGASNIAPGNPDLIQRIRVQVTKLSSQGIKPTADLLYTSASGLDPHITIEAAIAQIPRVAKSRSLSPDQVQALIAQNTDAPFLGIFGEPSVNVLKLNLSLDNQR